MCGGQLCVRNGGGMGRKCVFVDIVFYVFRLHFTNFISLKAGGKNNCKK